MDNIDRALRVMDSSSRDLVRTNLDLYFRTRDRQYAEEAITILRNFDDNSDVQSVINDLRR